MIKKIDIAGLQLDNYTVREMIMRVDRRISEKILTTIEEVNMDTLALAESDEEVKQSLEACDYTVIADEGILRAVSADTLQRRHEIEDHDFFYELFKRLERNDKKIFVIAESQKAVDEAEEFLLGLFDRARISGKSCCFLFLRLSISELCIERHIICRYISGTVCCRYTYPSVC